MRAMPDDGWLIRLAEAIARGDSPDWAEAASTAGTVEQRHLLAELRVVAEVAAVHRGFDRWDEADGEPAPSRWGPLDIRQNIGRGQFGTVYLAWDGALERHVALKLLRATAGTSEIMREGRLLARVRHPNVVTVYGVDQHDDAVGLWMEFVDGLTLSRAIATGGAMGAREAALIGVDLCCAVAAVHRAGLLHRDIKAQNVMREGSGRIVLMDFGAGKIRTDGSLAVGITGTPLYLAPEVFDGAPATIASDIYSIGVLLFHLVTTKYPVEGRTLEQIKSAHTRCERCRLSDARPDLPPRFAQVVERALARDPALRYRGSEEMQQDLMWALQSPFPSPESPVTSATCAGPTTGAVPAAIGRHTANARAYHLYLKGRFYWTRRFHGGLTAALEHFSNAIQEDAGYALAYAGLSDVYSFMGIYAVQPPRSVFKLATAAAERALTLDPDLPEAHTSVAFIKLAHEWDLPAAARAFARSLDLDPAQAVPRIYFSWLLVLQGDVATARYELGKAQEIEPLTPLVNAGAGHTFYLAKRYDEAIVECEKALEIDPNFILAIHVMGMCRALQGRMNEAIALGERTVAMSGRAPFYLGMLGHYCARTGAFERVQQILQELQGLAAQRYVPPHCMTYIYAGMGDLDQAFEWQARAEDHGASPFYYVSPLLENLQRDGRHREQMLRMGWKRL
jgi:tetratricopeptide (TPR) repeat protein